MIESIYRKIIVKKERICPQEGLALLKGSDLLDLAGLAREMRFRKNPEERVTFVVDSNPNYTNICVNNCEFCAFYLPAQATGAYTMPVGQLIGKFGAAAKQGVRTILLQGGVNPQLSLSYFLELVRRTREEVPQVHPHFFSPPEILGMAKNSLLTVEEVLRQLWEAGLRTLPGGGAEILSDRVKAKISPLKGASGQWLKVMREAHKIGFKSTATMMFGHVEKDEDILIHLEEIRKLQDEYAGFTAFIPWSFKPANSRLGAKVVEQASSTRYLKLLALARIYLDNFPHIQASWFSEGKKTGQVALHFGADDFGGTLLEENVHRAADFVNQGSPAEIISLIHEAGFDAAERDTEYNILSAFPRGRP